jgi:hypothetical protein
MRHLILFAIIICTVLAEPAQLENSSKGYGMEILYEHREYLADLLDTCAFGIGKYSKNCDAVFTNIATLKNAPLIEWEKQKEKLWIEFFHFCRIDPRIRIHKINGVLPNDTIFTEILAKALCYRGLLSVQREAFSILSLQTPYKLISRYRNIIIQSLPFSSLSKEEKNNLLSYCIPGESIKMQLREEKSLSVSAKIRLGDKIAENELIKEFETVSDFRSKEDIVAEMADAGTEKCLQFLIKIFNKPIYFYPLKYKGDSCIGRSIGCAVILGFQRHLPDDTLFNIKYNQLRSSLYGGNESFYDRPAFIQYVRDIMASFNRHYGIMPDDTSFIPILFGPMGCQTPVF